MGYHHPIRGADMALTDEDKEQAFQLFLKRSEPYNQAIYDAGDEPWHKGDIDKRRELFMRRYQR